MSGALSQVENEKFFSKFDIWHSNISQIQKTSFQPYLAFISKRYIFENNFSDF